MPLAKPVSELQRKISSIYDLCRENREPAYITRDGKADLVVMDASAFDEQNTLQRAAFEREMRLHDSIMRGWPRRIPASCGTATSYR